MQKPKHLTLQLTGDEDRPIIIEGDLQGEGLLNFMTVVFRTSKEWRDTCEKAIKDSYKRLS